MIFCDTNVLVSAVTDHERKPSAMAVFERGQRVYVPLLCRYEIAQVLGKAARNRWIDPTEVGIAAATAREFVSYEVPPVDAAVYVAASVRPNIPSYDAVWVYHAGQLGLRVVTFDRKLINAVPNIAISPEDYLAS